MFRNNAGISERLYKLVGYKTMVFSFKQFSGF